MNDALAREGIGSLVMEIFSPARVNGIAARLGMIPGLPLDLTTNDPDDGQPWDFNVKEKRNKALDMVLNKEALLVIGSPMCKAFSQLQNWNWNRMKPETKDKMIKEGREHLKFCMLLYRIQVDNGMYFLHEHPWGARSWDTEYVIEMLGIPGVEVVKGDMCAFGMQQRDQQGAAWGRRSSPWFCHSVNRTGSCLNAAWRPPRISRLLLLQFSASAESLPRRHRARRR